MRLTRAALSTRAPGRRPMTRGCLQVGDEVLNVCGLDVGNRALAPPVGERLHGPRVVLGEGQPLRDDVPVAIQLRELAERHRPGRRGRQAAGVELAPARMAIRSSSSAAPASAFEWISRLAHFDRLTRTPRKLPHHGCSRRSRFRPLCSQSLYRPTHRSLPRALKLPLRCPIAGECYLPTVVAHM